MSENPEYRKIQAAIRIQALFRGFIYRHHLSMLDQQNYCALKIQNCWRDHIIRQRIHKVQEIVALKLITRIVRKYKIRIESKKEIEKLEAFDRILSFFPSQSRNQTNSISSPQNKMRKGTSRKPAKPKDSETSRVREQISNKKKVISEEPSSVSSAKAVLRAMPSKKKILIPLPPPWHNKDPRRLAQSQRDELLFEQKGTLNWSKTELLPMFISKMNRNLDSCDDLSIRNERFLKRQVVCPCICPLLRCTKPLDLKSARRMSIIKESGSYVVSSCTSAAFVEITGFNDDKIHQKIELQLKHPLFDIIINKKSGHLIGLDSKWTLHHIEGGVSIISQSLSIDNRIPKASKYLYFDDFGLLWVNLIPQKGPILCIDPMTLQSTIQINYDNICTTYKYMNKVISLIPVSYNQHPLGFIGTFCDMSDVILFSYDFVRFRRLTHPGMKSVPIAKQIGQRIAIWSYDSTVYVYDLHERVELVSFIGSLFLNSPPVDVSYSDEPDLIYVGCEDGTLHSFLGHSCEYPLRIPDNKLSHEEIFAANRLLGPMYYTQSRKVLKEMRVAKYTSTPVIVEALSYSDRSSIVFSLLQNGAVGSIVYVNDSKSIPANEFDRFEFYEPLQSHAKAVEDFTKKISDYHSHRNINNRVMNILARFDSDAMSGQMKNLFSPGSTPFSFPDLLMKINIRNWHPYLPKVGSNQMSSYELFHFMYRAGFLPENISNFSTFLQRFAPDSQKRNIGEPILMVNQRLPVITGSHYHAIVDICFSPEDVNSVLSSMNPLSSLRHTLSNFTLSTTSDCEIGKDTTPRCWLSKHERKELTKRSNSLSLLEDLVKHELMSRVQKGIQQSFLKGLFDKIPVFPQSENRFEKKDEESIPFIFDNHPNRNPLIDGIDYRSIYDQWSKYTLYGHEKDRKFFSRAIHIPNSIFELPRVQDHMKKITQITKMNKKLTRTIINSSQIDTEYRISMIEDPNCLPLSHFLLLHSYLGGDSRLLLAARSICIKVLSMLHQLHQKNIIVRNLCPENILINVKTNNICFGSLLDCQTNDPSPSYLPLPKSFSNFSNPYLPPEFYHDQPDMFTPAFDVWQFGILLLYIITGFLPHSYGTELMEHRTHLSIINSDDPLQEPPKHPRIKFFYDWLKDSHLVKNGDRCIGDRGECYITCDDPFKPASILDIDHYLLLPYKSTKINSNESKLFLEIISCCLQIDPSNRPSVESLLRTQPFNQNIQSNDALEHLIKITNCNAFVSKYFAPILGNLNENTFDFTLGVIRSLVFFEDDDPEDQEYRFPLESKTNQRILNSIFGLKFVDKLVFIALDRISNKILLKDVYPAVTYVDPIFDKVLQFLMRFVANIEHGQGSLAPFTNEIIMSILALYTSNPYIRFSSSQLCSNQADLASFIHQDSAHIFVFTHTKVHGLLRYSLQNSVFILNSLTRSEEHNDWYFNQFINFGDSVFNFAHSMCSSIDKQKGNAIKTISTMWQNTSNSSLVRMFLDFRVPQKVAHCFHLNGAKAEAISFVDSAFQIALAKIFEPCGIMLFKAIVSPTVLTHLSILVRSTITNDSMRQQVYNIVKCILSEPSIHSTCSLVFCDILWPFIEFCREPYINAILFDLTSHVSINNINLFLASTHLKKHLDSNSITIIPSIDYPRLQGTLDIFESLVAAKQVFSEISHQQNQAMYEHVYSNPKTSQIVDFIIKTVGLMFRESESISKFLDTQILRAARYDIKDTTYLKAKNKAKESNIAMTQAAIQELSFVIYEIFLIICYFWRNSKNTPSMQLFDFLFETISSQIPFCRTKPHPSYRIHHCFQKILIHTIEIMPQNTQAKSLLIKSKEIVPKVFMRDIEFAKSCFSKKIIEVQLMERYISESSLRFQFFKAMLAHPLIINIEPMFTLIVEEMLHNPITFTVDCSNNLNQYVKFPFRTEAIGIIFYFLRNADNYPNARKILSNVLITEKFIEREKKIILVEDNILFIQSSMQLISALIDGNYLAQSQLYNSFKSLLTSFSEQYSGDFNESFIPNDIDSPENSDLKKSMITTLKKTSVITSPKVSLKGRPSTTFAKRPVLVQK